MKYALLFLFVLASCASRPPDPKRQILTKIDIHELGGIFSESGKKATHINTNLSLNLKEKNFIGGSQSESRALSSEDDSITYESTHYSVIPEPSESGYVRFFLFKNEESLGAISLKEIPGEKGTLSNGIATVSLEIVEIIEP